VQNSGEHGVVQNFQNALKICRGKFIAFSDQDDVWTDDHLQTLLDVLGENFLACANADLVDKNLVPLGKTMGELTGAGGNFGESTIVRLVFQNFVQGATTLFRRELLDFLPVPHGTIHDFYFAVLACMLGKISYSPKSILKYRQHENNVIGAGLGKVQEKKSFKQKIKDKKLYKKNVQRNRTGALNLGFEIFPKVQEILPPEKSAEVYKKLSDAKKIVVYKNIFAFKKYYSVIFLDEKRFDKFLLRFFSRYVRGILLLF
jgi:glycosyltransferase involved in cell wall biosynthesis